MEELQTLVTMVAGLPTITVWILAGYLLYRLVVVGSIYGVIRLAINRYFEYKVKPVVVQHKVSNYAINEDVLHELQVQIGRLVNGSAYIHTSDVGKLRWALDLIEKGEVK